MVIATNLNMYATYRNGVTASRMQTLHSFRVYCLPCRQVKPRFQTLTANPSGRT